MDFQRGLILTAGPSITSSEIESVMDAVTGGWNSRHSEFIKKFQDEFAAYIGVKHAMATSSCTGALHLSMLALDIKPGDEVLVPEMTWVASGAAPTYVGATPVFVDVEEDTWCLSPDSLRRNITPRTKAIVAVHLYGAPSNMPEIMRIAAEHRLTVIEDAAPAIGAHWGGKKMGTFGRTAAFSFQGAKLMVTGEGGMFCTDDSELYRKAQYLNDYAVDANRSYHVERLGLKYRMSNLQAALGIAQLRRIEELLERKRTIFGWYRERLGDLPELKLNVEKPESRNAFWMSSIVLAADLKIDRDTFRQKLKLKMVDTRPFFYPMSSLPMFKERSNANPIAYSLFRRGMNLPSGHNLSEDEIDYVCKSVREVLGKGPSAIKRRGPVAQFFFEKNRSAANVLTIPFTTFEGKAGSLRAITYATLNDPAAIEALAEWRKGSADAFPSQFKVSSEGTRHWLRHGVLDVKDRFLFWVIDEKGDRIGHIGLFRLSLDGQRIEIDNVVRGKSLATRGHMSAAVESLITWQRTTLGIPNTFLRVFSDNRPAIEFYDRLQFREILRVPLKKVVSADVVEWKEVVGDPYYVCQRYFITMEHGRNETNAARPR